MVLAVIPARGGVQRNSKKKRTADARKTFDLLFDSKCTCVLLY